MLAVFTSIVGQIDLGGQVVRFQLLNALKAGFGRRDKTGILQQYTDVEQQIGVRGMGLRQLLAKVEQLGKLSFAGEVPGLLNCLLICLWRCAGHGASIAVNADIFSSWCVGASSGEM